MLAYLLDTNLCIRALRDRPPTIREHLKTQFEAVCISSIVRYELYVGAAQSGDFESKRKEIDKFLSAIPCLPFDDEAAAHAAQIRHGLSVKGKIIGPHDLLIAGHARSLGLTVVTGNLGEFQRVDGLRCEDWL